MHALDDFAEQDEQAQRDQRRRGQFGGEFDLLTRRGVAGLDHRLDEIFSGNQPRPTELPLGQPGDHAVHDRIRPWQRLHDRDPAKEQRHHCKVLRCQERPEFRPAGLSKTFRDRLEHGDHLLPAAPAGYRAAARQDPTAGIAADHAAMRVSRETEDRKRTVADILLQLPDQECRQNLLTFVAPGRVEATDAARLPG